MSPQCRGLTAQEVFSKPTAIDTRLLGHAGHKVRAHYCIDGQSHCDLILYFSYHRKAQNNMFFFSWAPVSSVQIRKCMILFIL